MASDSRLLVPGTTTWRNARADRLTPIVDAAAYFRHLRTALLHARSSVLFIGWEFDTRIKLAPDDPVAGLPEELGPFLSELIHRRPGLSVRVLQWNLGLLGTLLRGTTPFYLLNWMSARRFTFRLDGAHPAGASHHQKIVVIDDVLAFCGGIDVTDDRWDTSEHRDGDGHRVRPSGRTYAPFHDATVAVDGDAAAALGDLARERWRRATGERIAPPAPAKHDTWPAGLAPLLRDVEVGITRTEPAYRDRPAIREVEQLYLAAIQRARRTIYFESQYFAARCIVEALAGRLAETNPPEVVIVNPDRARGWLEESAMGRGRTRALHYLAAADHSGRCRFYQPITAGGAPIYVHAKVMIVDDDVLRIGSSNLNNRSMGFDTECDLAVEAAGMPGREAAFAATVRAFRARLLAEHLGTVAEVVEVAVQDDGGSLIRTIEQLRARGGKTLVPIEMPKSAGIVPLPDGELLDPEQAEPVWRAAWHAARGRIASLRRRASS
ncbi:hypothetical protein VP06_04310 [Methylobacterium aquaticum]|uniref:Phospholipase D n=1 Tax=Methylobacterium aquaticum TaxID=270351 RepID=A0A0J6VJU1_9HYPH|nr:hypothetical protein VP06_04310 [Methylobacterium aquaticum]